ncbi:MAG: glycosyltransferase [Planctomycetota bacterium]
MAPPNTQLQLAIVSGHLTPYRHHLHRRVAGELENVCLHSLFTETRTVDRWAFEDSPQINAVAIDRMQPDKGRWLGCGASEGWSIGGRVIRYLIERSIDAVVLNGWSGLDRLRVLRWCHRHDVPLFIRADSNIQSECARGFKAKVKSFILPKVLKRTRGGMYMGRHGKAFFLKYGMTSDRLFQVPYEPDYSDFEGESEGLPRSFGSLETGFLSRRHIVFSGRFVDVKRVDLLIEAFVDLADRRGDWDLILLGDGPLRDELEASVPERLMPRVHWLGFVSDPAAIAAIYRRSDVLALPSDHEPWGVVVNEAAASGLAIVASSAVGAAADLVRDGFNGYTFERGDSKSFIKVLDLATDAHRIDSLKIKSHEVMREWKQLADPIQGLRLALESVRRPAVH